jgi:hypothetical protein
VPARWSRKTDPQKEAYARLRDEGLSHGEANKEARSFAETLRRLRAAESAQSGTRKRADSPKVLFARLRAQRPPVDNELEIFKYARQVVLERSPSTKLPPVSDKLYWVWPTSGNGEYMVQGSTVDGRIWGVNLRWMHGGEFELLAAAVGRVALYPRR